MYRPCRPWSARKVAVWRHERAPHQRIAVGLLLDEGVGRVGPTQDLLALVVEHEVADIAATVSTAWPSLFSSRTTVMSSVLGPAALDQHAALEQHIVLAVALAGRIGPNLDLAIEIEIGDRSDRLVDGG